MMIITLIILFMKRREDHIMKQQEDPIIIVQLDNTITIGMNTLEKSQWNMRKNFDRSVKAFILNHGEKKHKNLFVSKYKE